MSLEYCGKCKGLVAIHAADTEYCRCESSREPDGYGAWISVKNPPVLKSDENGFIRQRVMVFCEGEILLGYARKSYDGDVKFKADGRMGEWEITHWMPLPDAP